MRRLRRTLPLGLLVAAAVPASAQAARGFCSPTGDYCYGTQVENGAVRLAFSTFSFRGGMRICVTAPDASRSCKGFRLAPRTGGILATDVRWSAHFPNRGRGTYRVTFKGDGLPTFRPSVTFTR